MPVSHLELENFKSYAGIQRIGPFRSFTSIIGPNGAGKSNLMDAISFVLGVQSRDLRSSEMRDLIFCPSGTGPNSAKLSARATLFYIHEDEEGYEDGSVTRFGRAIAHDGKGEYLVNDRVVPFAKYEEVLGSIGVLIKVRIFLVFQSDVESIARKTPKQLVEMFENISGSFELKEEYDRLMREKEGAEQETVFAYNRQKGYKSERKQLKEQKDEAARFDARLRDKARLWTEFYLWQLFHNQANMEEVSSKTQNLQEEYQEMEEAENQVSALLRNKKKEASEARWASSTVKKKRVNLSVKADQMQKPIIQQRDATLQSNPRETVQENRWFEQ